MFCFFPLPGTEDLVVERMRVRSNGIDNMTREYVDRQVQVFDAFCKMFHVDKIFVNYAAESLNAEFQRIYNYIYVNY